MDKPCLLSLCAAARAVCVLFLPVWDAWHTPSQLLLEVLSTVGQVKGVRSLRKDLVLWVSTRYPASA